MRDSEHKLHQHLLEPPEEYEPIKRILPRALKQFQVDTAVSFDIASDHRMTQVEVVGDDRPGLLYFVSRVMLDCKIKLISAKVSTVGEKAEDTFIVSDRDGNPVDDPEQRQCLEHRIKHYLKNEQSS